MSDPLSPDDQKALRAAWSDPVEAVKEGAPQELALAFGMNFRVSIAKAFKAAWTTAKFCLSAERIRATGEITPETLMGLASDAFTIVVATLDALRERMGGAAYVACVVLSRAADGLSADEFKAALDEFRLAGGDRELPWYTFITKSMIGELNDVLADEEGFDDLLEALSNGGWTEKKQDQIRFKPRHFVFRDET